MEDFGDEEPMDDLGDIDQENEDVEGERIDLIDVFF